MKKVLLATTMLVAGASIAAAEVTVSGDARMGIVGGGNDDPATAQKEDATAFTSRARVSFGLTAESDSGLAFGASFRADNAAGAAAGTAGSVFISGAFGKLSMGDVDGAAQAATGNVAGVGLTGLGDLNESTFIGAGGLNVVTQAFAAAGQTANPNETGDPTLLYEYSAGAFTGYFSITNPADITTGGAGALNTLSSNAEAIAVGAKYTFGDYTIGVGHEQVKGYVNAGPGAAPVPAVDNTNLKHTVVSVSGTIAGLTVKGVYGKASGTLAGNNIIAPGLNGKQYAASATYTSGALSGTVFYTDDSGIAGGTAGYGIGGSYDLGGGAKAVGGVSKSKVNGPDVTRFDVGVSLSF
jgi:outer membrane protein OmpU